MALGRSSEVDPQRYELDRCPFCAAPSSLVLRVKPATAGYRVLSIDGGGIRAAIPIQFLYALERAVGLDIPIQELFDLGYGTSSGAMVILALYGLGMRVEETFPLFKRLSSRIFRGRDWAGLGIATFIASCRQGLFPASHIDDALTEICGEATMLDHPYMSSIGARIGFPVIDTDTQETCLVTSYNGAAPGPGGNTCTKQSTYRVLRSEGISSEILMKDATRCTSAAPVYFIPHEMSIHGKFMDGGLSHNNPCMLAVQELHRMNPELNRADQFVSIGTGMSTIKKDRKSNVYRSFLLGNNSLPHTLRHYWSENFDGDKSFTNMRQSMAMTVPYGNIGLDEWLHRFNLPMDEDLPDLSDDSLIDGLAEKAHSYFASDPAVRDLADALLASSFYFELAGSMPMYEQGSYNCYGRILCRIPSNNRAFPGLMRWLDASRVEFQVQKRLCPTKKPMSAWLNSHGNFSRPVFLRVSALEDELDVCLRWQGGRIHHISASPMTLSTMIKLQGLEWSILRDYQPTFIATKRKRQLSECSLRANKRRRVEEE